jgi:hypothetical protein
LGCASIATAQRIYTTVDGSTVVYPDVEPIMINGRVMVPLRGVFEHMGAYVEWDATNNEVRVSDDGTMCVLRIGSNVATVNGSVIPIDAAPIMHRGRTMVPLRFISETFGHDVFWNAPIRTVEITTIAAENPPNTQPPAGYTTIQADTVIPFVLQTSLSSSTSRVGDRFTARIDTEAQSQYQGLPMGTELVGHVSEVRARTSGAPGILGLEFDHVRLPNGNTYQLEGSLIGLDNESVRRENGRIIARDDASDDLKYVGYGAAAGVLVAIATDRNILTDGLIGAALGYLFGRSQVDSSKYNNVSLRSGTEFGVRLDRDLVFRSAATK